MFTPRLTRCVLAALIALVFLPFVARAQGDSTDHPAGYHVVKTVPIGGPGGWDYMMADPIHRHLFLSHGTHTVVLDMDNDQVVGDIPNTQGVHGMAIAEGLGKGFISDGGANQVTVFNLRTLETIATVPVSGQNPDCIIYDPASQRVFTFNGRTGNSTAIDARTDKAIGTFDLGGRPEYAQPDGRGHVFNNLEDKSTLLDIDARSLRILHRWPMAPCEHPSGLAIDAAHHRVFAGCHNEMMAIIDTDNGQVVAHPAIGQGVDANRFDPGTQLAFASTGDGFITVVREDTPNQFTSLGNMKTERGARTMALDTQTHTLYTVTASFGPMPPRSAQTQGRVRRPPMVSGSFRLLVISQ